MTEAQDEKELILGNKQLISLFFVVIALCGVCFAMGYIIGHNAWKPAVAADTLQTKTPAARAQDTEPPVQTTEQPGESAPDPASSPDSPTRNQPDSSAPDQTASPAAGGAIVTQPGRDVPETTGEAEPATVAVSPAPQPGSGSYLQVGAVSKTDAENLVKTLLERKLPALMAESPKKGLYRVLVGPYHQTADLAEAKSRLKTLGFDNAFVQK